MPLPSNLPVPHIVGDDEPDANSQIFPDPQLETDSCLSDSSYADDPDAYEKASSSSSDGADWSMNVTRISGTPGHIPSFAMGTPRFNAAVAVKGHMQIGENRTLPEEMEVDMPEPSLFSFLNLQPTSQAVNKKVNMSATSTSSKDDSPPKPGSSRKPGNASAAAQTRSARSLRSASGATSKRLDGRTGRIIRMRTRAIPDNTLAKPLDITAYFRVVSADLVRNRISRNTFQFLRDGIDRLLYKAYEDHSMMPKSSSSSH